MRGLNVYQKRRERSANCSERCKKFIDDDNFLTDDGREIYKMNEGRNKNYFNKVEHISIRNQFEYEIVLGIFFQCIE